MALVMGMGPRVDGSVSFPGINRGEEGESCSLIPLKFHCDLQQFRLSMSRAGKQMEEEPGWGSSPDSSPGSRVLQFVCGLCQLPGLISGYRLSIGVSLELFSVSFLLPLAN